MEIFDIWTLSASYSAYPFKGIRPIPVHKKSRTIQHCTFKGTRAFQIRITIILNDNFCNQPAQIPISCLFGGFELVRTGSDQVRTWSGPDLEAPRIYAPH